MEKKYNVFVYGSLKHGFGNHGLVDDQRYLGPGKTVKNDFIMVSLGGFPAVSEAPGKFYISGELYEVDKPTLAALDRLEGNGSLYTREIKEFVLGEKTIKAWIYLMPLQLAQLYYSRASNRNANRVKLDGDSLVWI